MASQVSLDDAKMLTNSSPVAAFQIRIALSEPADTICRPFAEKATDETELA
jgi:hypothetical protein